MIKFVGNLEHNLKAGGSEMDYRELVAAAELNLKLKSILTNYSVGEGTYLRQGAETNFVNRFNVQYFEHFGFKFRLIDSQEASTDVTFFNHKFKTPIMSAAVSGMNDIAEKPLVKIASGIRDSGSMMWLGVGSLEQLKEVVDTGAPTVRIVKPFKDNEAMIKALKEAEDVGAIAVGTDIDFFYGSKRGDKEPAPKTMGPKTVEELKMLAKVTKLPFVLKGVLSAEDAKKALDIGAGGIVVSNHAGVVIDYAAHPLEVLPEIKEVIGDRMPIFVDSGFRRGSDVMKALALGADGILGGWAMVMGLAASGSAGVTEIVNILTAELQRIMSITGCKQVSDIDSGILVTRH
jgi:isopentenyl diphosphate isomerase/L-lactate dehydrogenase-like FMN-dependent dehydrogenase